MVTSSKPTEHDLLSAIIRYIVPVVEQKSIVQLHSPLEHIAKTQGENQHGQEIPSKQSRNLHLKEIQKSIDAVIGGMEGTFVAEKRHTLEEGVSYSFKRTTTSSKKYRVEVKYHGSATEEKIDVRFSLEEIEETQTTIVSKSNRKEKKEYAFTLVKPRDMQLPKGYALDINYQYRNGEENAVLTYTPSKPYIQKHIETKNDATEKVPLKQITHMLPESILGGILGFTYIGENFMGRRDDLVGWWARMVDIHESIHTPDEYETRVLTDHIMDRTPPRYPMIPQFILPKMEYKQK